MIRTVALAFACCFAAPALAQPTPEVERAVRALAANWRPIAPERLAETAAVERACAGAIEEIAAVEAALPAVISPASLARVRALMGLVIVADADAPGGAFFFPPSDLAWFTSGAGAVAVVSETEGFLALRDAAGRDIAVQLGRVGGRAVLRLRDPEGHILTHVGCAPTLAG